MWKELIQVIKGDDLYTQALRESYEMLDLDLTMFEVSVKSLRQSDTGELEQDVYALDKRINAFEQNVRKKVMTHLAVSGPGNLTSGLVLISIVIDIERIGDYAKNISDLARSHPKRLHGHSIETELVDIEGRVSALFKDTVQAFKDADEQKSREIMLDYKGGVSGPSDELVHRIVSGQITDLAANDAAAIALYIRYLKRIAGHSRNIITSVVNPFHRIGYREKTDGNSDV